MKAKVLIPFRDKVTGKKHKSGDVIDVSAKRFNEIAEKGKFLILMEQPTTASNEEKPKKAE